MQVSGGKRGPETTGRFLRAKLYSGQIIEQQIHTDEANSALQIDLAPCHSFLYRVENSPVTRSLRS